MPGIRDQINEWITKAEARGSATYGLSLEENNDGRNWSVELIEELVDALQYAAKDLLEKDKLIATMQREIDRLAKENKKFSQTPFGDRSDKIPY